MILPHWVSQNSQIEAKMLVVKTVSIYEELLYTCEMQKPFI